MKKIILFSTLFFVVFFLTTHEVKALIGENSSCAGPGEASLCTEGLICKYTSSGGQNNYFCVKASGIEQVFGHIEPPQPIKDLGFGATGISNVLNKIILFIYVVAGIIFIFLVVISAVQWMLSGGDKEKVAGARNRLTYAIIGITLLSLSFVIIKLIGQITGFTFFVGQ